MRKRSELDSRFRLYNLLREIKNLFINPVKPEGLKKIPAVCPHLTIVYVNLAIKRSTRAKKHHET